MKSPALLTRKKHKEHDLLPQSQDRRSTPRFEVEFRTLISDKSGINDQVGGDPGFVSIRVPCSSATYGLSNARDGVTYLRP